MPPKVYMAIRGTNRVRSTEERAAKTQVTRTSLCFDSQLKACGMQVVDSCYMIGIIDQWCYLVCCTGSKFFLINVPLYEIQWNQTLQLLHLFDGTATL